MRFILILTLAIWISPLPVSAQNDQIEEFNAAYRAYTSAYDKGRFARAALHAETALEHAEKLLADDPGQVAIMTFLLGEVMYFAHKTEACMPVLELAIERYKAAFGARDVRVAQPMFVLANANERLAVTKNVKHAERLLEETLEIYQEAYGKKDPRLSEPLRRLAYNSLRQNNGRRADGFMRQAINLTESAGPEFAMEHNLNLLEHGRVAMSRRANKKAIKRFIQLRNILLAQDSQELPLLLTVEAQLIEAYERDGQSDKATEHVQNLARIDPRQETSEPVPLFRVIHDYPFSAAEKCREGYIVVEFTIDAEGKVKDANIIESKPKKIFDRAGLKAVNRYRYRPRIQNGVFVETPGQKVRLTWSFEGSSRKGWC